jgi:hypothetical protein
MMQGPGLAPALPEVHIIESSQASLVRVVTAECPMLSLLTFGRLVLQLNGRVITGVATQRPQLALLALLAVAGDDGMSREKVQGYLWPAGDGVRASTSSSTCTANSISNRG